MPAPRSVVSGIPRDRVHRFVADNYGLVVAAVRRYSYLCAADHEDDYEDALVAGSLGLLHAAERYDASRGVAFSTFATSTIRGYVLKQIRDQRRARPFSLSGEAVSLTSSLPQSPDLTILDVLADLSPGPAAHTHSAAHFDDLMRCLTARQASVMRAIYCEGYTQTEVAEALGITRAGCSYLVARALDRLKAELSDTCDRARGPTPGRRLRKVSKREGGDRYKEIS